MSSSPSETDKFDASRRRLCPDGACVGLLDDAGTCKECGLTASGERVELAAATPDFTDELDEADNAELEEAEPVETTGAPALPAGSGGFDPKRRLCPDGACVGVLGPDGRCKVCGQGG
jgi:hypothetical protein